MSQKKTISIHQPNFIPWLGYFHKIINSDIFIILDTVQYPRGKSVANRSIDPVKLKIKARKKTTLVRFSFNLSLISSITVSPKLYTIIVI